MRLHYLEKSFRRIINRFATFIQNNYLLISYNTIFFLLLYFQITDIKFLYYPTPQGFDISMYYLYRMNQEKAQPTLFLTIREILYRPVLLIALIMLNFFFPYETSFIILYHIIIFFYFLSLFYLLKSLIKDSRLQFFILCCNALTISFIRLSYDLLGNFFAFIFFYLFIATYFKGYSSSSPKKLFEIALLALINLTTHAWTWGIILMSLIFQYLITTFARLASYRKIFMWFKREYHIIAFLSINVGILFFVNVLFNNFIGEFVKLQTPSIGDTWFINKEIWIILFLALLGSFYIYKKERITKFEQYLLFLTFVISMLLLFINFSYPYRFYLLYPIGFLAGYGTYFIYLRINILLHSRKKQSKKYYYKVKVYCCKLFFLFLFLSLFDLALIRSYMPEYVYRPENKALQQIYWLHYKYGYANTSVIIPIFNPPTEPLDKRSSSNIVGWSRGYLGDSIYVGSIFDLVTGKPDIFNHVYNYSNIEQREIILASKLYRITSFIYLFCEKISELGIYKFSLKNFTQINNALIRYSNWIDYGFKGNWGIKTNTLNVSVNAIHPNYTSIRIPQNINSSGWFTIEYLMDDIIILNISTLLIMISGFLNTSRFNIEVYNLKYAFVGEKIHSLNTTRYWIVIPLYEGEIIHKIRFSIYNNGTRSSLGEFINISYIALI